MEIENNFLNHITIGIWLSIKSTALKPPTKTKTGKIEWMNMLKSIQSIAWRNQQKIVIAYLKAGSFKINFLIALSYS